jgi:hypothetical protein
VINPREREKGVQRKIPLASRSNNTATFRLGKKNKKSVKCPESCRSTESHGRSFLKTSKWRNIRVWLRAAAVSVCWHTTTTRESIGTQRGFEPLTHFFVRWKQLKKVDRKTCRREFFVTGKVFIRPSAWFFFVFFRGGLNLTWLCFLFFYGVTFFYNHLLGFFSQPSSYVSYHSHATKYYTGLC